MEILIIVAINLILFFRILSLKKQKKKVENDLVFMVHLRRYELAAWKFFSEGENRNSHEFEIMVKELAFLRNLENRPLAPEHEADLEEVRIRELLRAYQD